MPQRRHHTYRVFRVGVGWRSACRGCPWRSEPTPVHHDAKADGRVHELYPQGVDWSRVAAWL